MARIHNNLGHPTQPNFVRTLIDGKANIETITCAKALRCAVCLRHRSAKSLRPGRMIRVRVFGELIYMDIFFVHDAVQDIYTLMGILDECTTFHVVARLSDRSSGHALHMFS